MRFSAPPHGKRMRHRVANTHTSACRTTAGMGTTTKPCHKKQDYCREAKFQFLSSHFPGVNAPVHTHPPRRSRPPAPRPSRFARPTPGTDPGHEPPPASAPARRPAPELRPGGTPVLASSLGLLRGALPERSPSGSQKTFPRRCSDPREPYTGRAPRNTPRSPPLRQVPGREWGSVGPAAARPTSNPR